MKHGLLDVSNEPRCGPSKNWHSGLDPDYCRRHPPHLSKRVGSAVRQARMRRCGDCLWARRGRHSLPCGRFRRPRTMTLPLGRARRRRSQCPPLSLRSGVRRRRCDGPALVSLAVPDTATAHAEPATKWVWETGFSNPLQGDVCGGSLGGFGREGVRRSDRSAVVDHHYHTTRDRPKLEGKVP